VIRTNVDALASNDLHGPDRHRGRLPRDDSRRWRRRPAAARLLEGFLLRLGRTVILVGQRLASGLLSLRPRRLVRARRSFARPRGRLLATGASTRSRSYREPAHIGASATGSPAYAEAAPATGAAHVGASAGVSSHHAQAWTTTSPAHVGARPASRAAHIGASAVRSIEHAMARLSPSPAHIGASAFESPAHVGAPPLPRVGSSLVKSSAVPQPRRARPLRREGLSRSPRWESRPPSARPDCTRRRLPGLFAERGRDRCTHRRAARNSLVVPSWSRT